MLTVALPIWNNRNIAWLPMEGLCAQRTSVKWELIIMECFSTGILGEDYFMQYKSRLQDAGCTRIVYLYSDVRLQLSRKWKEMYRKSKGKYFCLQGSDDYPHPSRNQDVWNAGADWYDLSTYYHFDLNMKKMMQYDNKGKGTGFNMAIRTKMLKRLPKDDVSRYVDGYLYSNTQPKEVTHDPRTVPGISTNGANAISITRNKYYENPVYPFQPTGKTIFDIGIPIDIAQRLMAW